MMLAPSASTSLTVSSRSAAVGAGYVLSEAAGPAMSTAMIDAPSRASRTAWLRPWPRAAPVTNATRPASRDASPIPIQTPQPFLVTLEMVGGTTHHDRFGGRDDHAVARQLQRRLHEDPSPLPSHDLGPADQWPLDGDGFHELDLQRARDHELAPQKDGVADHFVDDSGGPPAVRHVGTTLVVSRALDFADHDAVGAECLAVQTESAFREGAAGAAQHDAGGRPHRMQRRGRGV